jgi:hypothetical protein
MIVVRGVIAISMVATSPVVALPTTYVCDTKTGLQLSETGQLVPTAMTRYRIGRQFLFEGATGIMRWPGSLYNFEVLQAGTNEHSIIAQRLYRGPKATVVQILRI